MNKQGVEARRRNDDVSALVLFRRAYELHHTPRSAAQMGLAEIALGRWSDAEVHLEQALAVRDDPWIQRNEQVLRETLARVQNQFGSLQVLGSPSGAEVLVEGKVLGRLPMANRARVRIGECRFEVRAPGHVPVIRSVAIDPNTPRRETVDLSPVVAEVSAMPEMPRGGGTAGSTASVFEDDKSARSPDDDAGGAHALRSWAWATSVAAAGSLIFGVVQTVVAVSKKTEFENHTGPNPGNPDMLIKDCGTSMLSVACKPIQEAHDRAVILSIVGYAASGVFAAASGVLFLVSSRDDRPSKTALACLPDPLHGGIACNFRF